MEDIPMTKIRRYWHNEPVNIDCKIEDLITTSMNQNFVPVIDDKNIFIGIVTRRDIIQYCYEKSQGTATIQRIKAINIDKQKYS